MTSFTNHYAVQRQIQLCFDLKKRINFTKGLFGTYLRNTGKGMLLYAIYFKYFDWLAAKAIQNQYQKRSGYNKVPSYNRSKSLI